MTSRPELFVDEQGSGPPMVFVHGFLNDGSIWTDVVAELRNEFRCIVLDLPGHGRSAGTGPGTYGRDHVLGDVRAVMDAAGIESATFVGHSLGGYLSLALAITDPARVTALGLVGAGPGFRKPESREQWNESVRSIAADRDIPEGMEEISMHVDSLVLDRLHEITVPTAVVLGERDKPFTASAAVFEKYLNVVSKTVVADAGHMVHRKAASAVAEALRQAFSSASG